MHIIFALYKYFPFGGLQKDTLRMAEEARNRGHQCTILTTAWEGELPEGINVQFIRPRGLTNYGKMKDFQSQLDRYLAFTPHDTSVAMNRFGGCDWYFVADYCQASWLPRLHSRLMLWLNPRYRTYLAMERSIFSPQAKTHILHICPAQKAELIKCYGTQEERFHLLPPGMNPDCVRPANAGAIRQETRRRLGVSDQELLLCNVGANLTIKGGARSIRMLASLPDSWKTRCRLLLVGEQGKLPALADELGVADRCIFTGPSKEVPSLLFASDLMVHPAIQEPTGTILIEGIAAGLPVLCSEVCGFEYYVREAGGKVVPEPFRQETLNALVPEMLANLAELTRIDRAYASKTDFTSRARATIDLLENQGQSSP